MALTAAGIAATLAAGTLTAVEVIHLDLARYPLGLGMPL
jgi:hypothetical protein